MRGLAQGLPQSADRIIVVERPNIIGYAILEGDPEQQPQQTITPKLL